jgi:hypothetical protein
VKLGLPSEPGHPQLVASPRGRQASAARSPTARAILRCEGLAVKERRRGCGCGAAGATLDAEPVGRRHFLVLEMKSSLDSLMKISSAPLRKALEFVGQ